MTKEKMIEVLNKYEKYLKDEYLIPKEFNEKTTPGRLDSYCHILYMIPKMRKFLDENKIEKVNRWLGFIQGVLWAHNDFSLSELKDDNREVEKPVVNGRTYPKEIMEEAVRKEKEVDLNDYYSFDPQIRKYLRHKANWGDYQKKELITLYPNKFKVIRGMEEVSGDGIYYINDKISGEMIEPLTNWITDLHKSRLQPVAGLRTEIMDIDFYEKYNLEHLRFVNLYKAFGMPMAKDDYYYSNGLNPIRFFLKSVGSSIVLWGQNIKHDNVRFINNIHTPDLTIDTAITLMNILNFLVNTQNDIYMIEVLNQMKNEHYIYDYHFIYDENDYPQYIKIITRIACCPHIIDFIDATSAEYDLNVLKGLLIK